MEKTGTIKNDMKHWILCPVCSNKTEKLSTLLCKMQSGKLIKVRNLKYL